MRRLGWIIAIVVFTVVGIYLVSQTTNVIGEDGMNVHKEQLFSESEIREIDVNTSSTDIRFVKGESDQVVVKLSGNVKDWDDYRYEVQAADGTLKVNLEKKMGGFSFGFFNRDSLKLSVTLPEKAYDSLKIHTSSGEVDISGVEAARVLVDTSSGDIHLSNMQVEEQLEADVSSGDITISQVTGGATADWETSSGDIVGKGLEVADSKAHTSSGSIDLNFMKLAGDVFADTSSGDVAFSFDEEPESFVVDFKASSGDEKISIDGIDYEKRADNRVEGQKGDGTYLLEVRTSSGDFRLD
ncbi:DUF4097 family beta strand repeat-containing protein [Thalassobacillus hwangdonensis]|uniref:DUF4097 family beta strand repeat-containing protein n=1 Tax=Thalassobacillus hwangdonensis TaxID=546108 RepID=A0ABW3L0V2_9BACI